MASDEQVTAAERAVRAEYDKICDEMGMTTGPVTVVSPTNPRLLRAAIDAAESVRSHEHRNAA